MASPTVDSVLIAQASWLSCLASSTLSGRIDSPFLLLRDGSLPHRRCYPRIGTTSGGRDGETDQVDYATGTDGGHKAALRSGRSKQQEDNPGRVRQGDWLSSQTRDSDFDHGIGRPAEAAGWAPHLPGSGEGSADCSLGSIGSDLR